MLNVLLVYYEPIPAGQTTHVFALARDLDRRRFRVTVALPARLERSAALFRELGIDILPLPMRKIVWPLRSMRALIRWMRAHEVDVFHVHSQEAGLIARVLARLGGARHVIYTPQVIDIRQRRWHGFYVLVERVLARVTDTIISVNEPDRERMVEWGVPSHKIQFIPNGIDLQMFTPPLPTEEACRTLEVDEDARLVMQVGRLSAQKAPLAFVEGARRVAEILPGTQFVLVGEGPLKSVVRERIRELGLSHCVHLAGWHPHAYRLIPAADVVTLTSQWEGTPYTLLEAMAWSRPVVVTAVNGCLQVVEDGVTGFLVPPGNIAAWTQRVVDLLLDPALADRMGRKGRERVRKEFSLERMITDVEHLYLRITQHAG